MVDDDGPTTATMAAADHATAGGTGALGSHVGTVPEAGPADGHSGATPPERRRRARRGLHALSWLVLVLTVAGSVASALIARETVRDQERRQLSLKAAEVSSLLSLTITSLDANISALIAASDGQTDHTVFDRLATPMVTSIAGRPAAYREVAAVRQSAGGPVVTASAGEVTEKSVLTAGPRVDALQKAWQSPGVLHATPVFLDGQAARLGFAKASAGGGAVYVEATLQRSPAPTTSGPFSDLTAALYSSSTQQPGQVLLSTTRDLPLKGHIATANLAVGADKWLVVIKARTSLVGGLAKSLPWILLGAGLLTAALATMSVEVLARRRDYGWALVAERTSELKATNEQLENRVAERTARLNASNQELEAFAYSVSHDLRTPLRAIDGFSKALLEDYADKLDDVGRNFLDRVRAAAQRMDGLIDDVLHLSRVSRAEIRGVPFDLSATAREIVADYRDREPQRVVDAVVADGLVVEGDPTLLRTLLENLLGNAWKFTATHESARIELGETDRDGEQVFFVRDDGVGFDMAFAEKLFSPFERMHEAQEFPGTGIGLATVERIVRRHGGRLWADAGVDQGATFYFTLGGPALGGDVDG